MGTSPGVKGIKLQQEIHIYYVRKKITRLHKL